MRGPALARRLLALYSGLLAYGSLYPFSGWREPVGGVLGFLSEPWPRYVTGFDLAANVLAYLPFGLLFALAARPRLGAAAAAAAATLAGAALSLALEAGQSYLPSRIASHLDILTNAAGAAAGALAAVVLETRLAIRATLARLRAGIAPGAPGELGLTLLALWLFAQLNPAMLPFGAGDLRDLVAAAPGERHDASLFVAVEATIAAANLAAVALLASAALAEAPAGSPREGALREGACLGGLLAAAIGVKTLATAIVMRADGALAWLTPGAQIGLAAGAALAAATLRLPRTARLALAAVLLMAATALVNLAPPNPYFAEILKVWQQGHFLNFNGLTRLVGVAWPFAALVYLIWLAALRPPGTAGGIR